MKSRRDDKLKLGIRQQLIQKRPKAPVATTTIFPSTSTSTCQPGTESQVLSPTKTALPPLATNKTISRSPSLSVERSRSPLPKKQQQQPFAKTPIKKHAPTFCLGSTPMVNRLRAKLNDHNAIVSPSSCTSSSQSVVTATKSKDKQTVSAKKHQHLSENEESVNVYNLFYQFAVILRQLMLNLLRVQIVV
ncbi:unnamed protein product [Didymodactylos carnosus]|uniref:Uncharacterized protein n=1 Tax=Didymodactylos carnosus TaxID=1234261 RepID=A0A816DBM1_9BILA|nr:unnamed protein product [Didymodactylos carnosus]CAF1632755.1 unnamed protein product [Didymodactylos carnosus]CAF4431992.1 unnamed protein product [Didymodactylos carnosus]CAF4534021.1 unnamed protein product [Didymodactylos carnosus]